MAFEFGIRLINNRLLRHSVFWIIWVLSFTVIKSFGTSLDVYLAWFVYYIFTLPLFMVHTYLIVYFLVPHFLNRKKVFVFILINAVLIFMFSFLELVLSNELISRWYPLVFSNTESYLSPIILVINGVGNLYIVLVFVAGKMMRSWYLVEREKVSLERSELLLERADVNARVQPELLLNIIDLIRKNSKNEEECIVSHAIAKLSELMNDVMRANELHEQRVDEEISMVKKMLEIYASINGDKVLKLAVDGNDLHKCQIASFMLFSPLEIILRMYDYCELEGFYIRLNEQKRVPWIDFIIQFSSSDVNDLQIYSIQEGINKYYPYRYEISNGLESGSFRIRERDVNVVC